jgi:hypothetical protein
VHYGHSLPTICLLLLLLGQEHHVITPSPRGLQQPNISSFSPHITTCYSCYCCCSQQQVRLWPVSPAVGLPGVVQGGCINNMMLQQRLRVIVAAMQLMWITTICKERCVSIAKLLFM